MTAPNYTAGPGAADRDDGPPAVSRGGGEGRGLIYRDRIPADDHQTFYNQVKTADQKAGYICTFLTILFAWSKEQGNVLLFLSSPPSWSPPWILSLVFAGAAAFSIACTALVILPRVTTTGTSSMYWGSWIDGGIKM